MPVLIHGAVAAVSFRYGFFTLLVLLLIFGIWWLGASRGVALFSEGSPLEWLQLGLLAGTFLTALHGAVKCPRFKQLMRILAILPALAIVRELDATLDTMIPKLGWHLPFHMILIPSVFYGWSNRTILARQLKMFVGNRSFGLMWAGLMVSMPFAQLIGHGDFLEQLFGNDYQRPFKRLIEECCELLGYLLILLASIDWVWQAGKNDEPAS